MLYNVAMVLSNVIAALAFFIMPAPTVLFGSDGPVVTLPAGYFVMQAGQDAPTGYLSVAYDDLRGYVKASDVTAVDYTPVNKYETSVRFYCDNDGQPVNMRVSPHKSAAVVKTLSPDAGGHAYGTLRGDALIKNGDTLWYYVTSDGVRGYCYYAHISVDDTPPNTIQKEEDAPSVPAAADATAEPKTLPKAAVITLIVALCVPVPVIMLYLFKKPKDRV